MASKSQKTPDEDDVLFAAEEDEEPEPLSQGFWKVMIVDDDEEVHNVTRLALGDFSFDGKTLEFISVFSDKEARQAIVEHPDTAAILLDVVMEADDSGLQFVKYLRHELQNRMIRIILRTGQPGMAPEARVISDYDINDYRTKTELTSQKMFNTMIVALRSFRDLMQIEAHKDELQKLVNAYERFVPHEFLHILNKNSITDVELGDQVQEEMTVLFSDIRDFTRLSEKMTPEENFKFTNSYLSRMEPSIRAHHGFVDKFIGDAIMALFPTCADDAVQAAVDMLKALVKYNQDRSRMNYDSVRVGVGLNTGVLMLGTVGGQSRMDGTVISDAVNLASRIESMTKIYGASLLIGERTYDQLSDPLKYVIRPIGQVMVKGKTEAVKVYEVLDGDPPDLLDLKRKTLVAFERGVALYHKKCFDEALQTFAEILEQNPADRPTEMYMKLCKKYQEQDVPMAWTGVIMMT
ncbi:MAG: adenylate cyclase [Candidatus Latescibacterota bacterium]|jgi:adenylate cyclase